MYILLEACMHPAILKLIYFILILVDIIFIVVPIGLIVMLLVDLSKALISGNEENAKKSVNLAKKRILYVLIIFCVPWIVNVFNSALTEMGLSVEYNTCIANARRGEFSYYESLLEEENSIYHNSWKERLSAIAEAEAQLPKTSTSNYSESSINKISSGSTYESAAEALINHAKKETGTVGGKKYIGSTGKHWCAAFVTWNLKNVSIDGVGTIYSVFTKEGNITSDYLASGTTKECYEHSNLNFYPSKQYGGNYTPKKGDIIYFWYPSTNGGQYWDRNIEHVKVSSTYAIDHVGLVDYVDSSGKVHTVEGNTGGTGNPNTNRVGQNSYSLSYDGILGYCSWYDSKK